MAVTEFKLPPVLHNSGGEVRRVGYELEYTGIDLATSVEFMAALLGSTPERTAPFRYTLKSETLGTFTVEVDASLLQKDGYKESLAALGLHLEERTEQAIEDMLEGIASVLVPYEIITPPLPMSDQALMDDIVAGLRARKAKGTGQSILYAFGVHLNPEVVCLDADYLLRHIRAFTLLYDWICREAEVDFTRRLGPHVKPYPAEYIRTITNPHYAPTIGTLTDDYLQLVGSRNHALDMLPVLAHIDEERVLAHTKEPELVKARPTFHYRLANSQVDILDWDIAGEWNIWVAIEALAHDESKLMQLCHDYVARNQSSMFRTAGAWADHVDRLLK